MNLIFDFDGTLVDSFDEAVNIFNFLAEQFHFRKVARHEIPKLKDLTSLEVIKYVQLPLFKIPAVLLQARKIIRKKMQVLLPVPGMKDVLTELNGRGFKMGILTSNAIENVKIWLQQHDMLDLFQFIDNESSFFGKNGKLKKVLRSRKIPLSDTYYIGDETRDIDAARHCKIGVVAVGWGFNSEKALAAGGPDYLINDARELLKIFS